jgi:hypothetical protein
MIFAARSKIWSRSSSAGRKPVPRRVSRPRRVGLELLARVGARCPEHIDPIETAKELGIEIVFGHLTGATARIFRVGTKARIRVSDDIVTPGRRRTSIAHELGHFALDHELPTEGDPASWFKTSCQHRCKRDERDADVLAVEHLTPTSMVEPYCQRTPIDLHAVREIERTFVASPVMSAMRFVELSPHPCAVAYSVSGAVKWMKPSRSFPNYVAGGKLLARDSVASSYFERGALPAGPVRVPASVWLGASTQAEPNHDLVEHAMVIPEPGWGGVLSMLWLPDWKAPRSRRAPAQKDRGAPKRPSLAAGCGSASTAPNSPAREVAWDTSRA